MSTLTIRVHHQGLSREYLFTGAGPYTIGAGDGDDVVLNGVVGHCLQIKVSGGKIYLHRLGTQDVQLAHRVLPVRAEILYTEGHDVVLGEYQVTFSLQEEDSVPPPFFEADFRDQYDQLNKKINHHKAQLKGLVHDLQHNERRIVGTKEHLFELQKDKHHFELLIDQLKVEKRGLEGEIGRNKESYRLESSKLSDLASQIEDRACERESLQQHIHKLQLDIRQFKVAHEEQHMLLSQEQKELQQVLDQIALAEQRLSEVNALTVDKKTQLAHDEERLESVLKESQSVVEERHRLQENLQELRYKRDELQIELQDLSETLLSREEQIKQAQQILQDQKKASELEESHLKSIKQKIEVALTEEMALKSAQEVIKLENQKVSSDHARRRAQFASLEAEHQEAHKNLARLRYEADDCEKRIQQLMENQQRQEYRLQAINKEVEHKSQQHARETQRIAEEHDELVKKLARETRELTEKIENLKLAALDWDKRIELSRVEFEKWHKATTGLKVEKAELDAQLQHLGSERVGMHKELSSMQSQVEELKREHVSKSHELQDLSFKLQETHTHIRQAEEESQLELQSRKREFEQKILYERELLMTEVEVMKKKALADVENEKRKREEELRRQTDHLLVEAQDRLKRASLEAQEREAQAHKHLMEAQAIYQEREASAHALKVETEARLQRDYLERQKSMKSYLAKKQQKTIKGLAHLTDVHLQKLTKVESRALEKIDLIKRKELKKIAALRESEMSKYAEMKDKIALEMREERKRTLGQLQKLKQEQERELEQAKKVAMQNLNQTKQRSVDDAQSEIQREKAQFEKSKEQRLQNATRSVLKLMGQHESVSEQQVRQALRDALDGKFTTLTHEGEKILEFNPLKQKAILPVLKKYGLRFGLPAAAALVLALDVGFVRSGMVNLAKTAMKQKESAAEKFVQQQKQEWREKNTYNPETSLGYKKSYVDNILYTTDFLAVMESEAFQNDWILKLHDFITKDLELSEDIAISYISSEGALMKELGLARGDLHPNYLDQGLKKLADLEQNHMGWLPQKITDQAKLTRLTEFRAKHFDDYYQNQFKANRSVASEPKAPAINEVIAPIKP